MVEVGLVDLLRGVRALLELQQADLPAFAGTVGLRYAQPGAGK